jgi:hypothetical protein
MPEGDAKPSRPSDSRLPCHISPRVRAISVTAAGIGAPAGRWYRSIALSAPATRGGGVAFGMKDLRRQCRPQWPEDGASAYEPVAVRTRDAFVVVGTKPPPGHRSQLWWRPDRCSLRGRAGFHGWPSRS